MNIELQRVNQPEITEYPEAELEMVRREIALEQTGVDPKLAIEHMLIAKFGLNYRYEELSDTQMGIIRDTALEAFSRHIEHPNHSINDDTLRGQVLLLWAKLGNQDIYTTADMFSVEDDKIDAHALEGLYYICGELPHIPESRFKKITPVLAGIQIQTPADDTPPPEPELPPRQEPVQNSDPEKFDHRKHLTVPGVSPDVSRRKPVKNFTEDEVPLTSEQLKSTDYEKLLFQKVANHRILSREEVTELSKDIEAGLVAKHKLENMAAPSTDSKSEATLYEELRALSTIGDRAKDKLIRHNLRLVMRIAASYQQRAENLDFTDLFTEGTFGLMHAVEKFDYKKGFAISTYATTWIHQYIRRSIQQTDRVVYLPEHILSKRRQIIKAAGKYQETFGVPASDTELAAYMDMPLDAFTLIKQAISRTASLNTPMGEKGDEELGDLLYDENEKTTDSMAIETMLPTGTELCDIIAKHVGDIDAAQALILSCGLPLHSDIFEQTFIEQHGIEPGTAYSLDAIGAMFGVTKYAIYARIEAAKKILTEPHVLSLLRDSIVE